MTTSNPTDKESVAALAEKLFYTDWPNGDWSKYAPGHSAYERYIKLASASIAALPPARGDGITVPPHATGPWITKYDELYIRDCGSSPGGSILAKDINRMLEAAPRLKPQGDGMRDALVEIASWLRNGDYDTRGGLIEMDRLASIAEAALASHTVPQPGMTDEWNAMDTVPRNEGEELLLLTRTHGIVEARWAPGEWSSEIPGVCGREYSGAVWVCGDDAWQIEVEEGPDNYYHDGEAIGWLPRSALPARAAIKRAAAGESPQYGWQSDQPGVKA